MNGIDIGSDYNRGWDAALSAVSGSGWFRRPDGSEYLVTAALDVKQREQINEDQEAIRSRES